MFSWGCCDHGQLALGGITDLEICRPRQVSELPVPDISIQDIKAGDSHTVILSNDGKLFTCGSNEYGQLGHESLTQRRLNLVSSLGAYTIKSISCGANHCLAVDEWGKVFSWGTNDTGQLGHNQSEVSQLGTPKLIKGLGTVNVIQIASGANHNLALTKGGQLYAWGDNKYGQLGIGPVSDKSVTNPLPIDCLTSLPIRFIACGGQHSVLVSHSGAVYAWGRNNRGQLGLGDTEDRIFPTQVRSLRNQRICHISCGDEHTICLTEDGGVFSFGSGQYGQLGHGSKSDEQLPRKIIELMGTDVSQIACGKRHTLAFIPTRGRLYAFGLGGSGQLGNGSYSCATTPQVVHGPWVGPTGEPSAPKRVIEEMNIDPLLEPVVITNIGAGGDQSFAVTSEIKKKVSPVDYRLHLPTLEMLTTEIIDEMLSHGPEDCLDQDFLEKLEIIFQNPACINSSFLLPSHKPCTSKNHGVDLKAWNYTTKRLSKITNDTIKELITTGLTKYIIPKLEKNPPDVETLRQFLIYPMFAEFENNSLYKEIHCAFAKGWISLPKAAWNVVEKWFAQQGRDFLLPIIENYKKTVIHILDQPNGVKMETELGLVLVFLRILNRINVSNNCIVSYEDFYIPEITDYIDLSNSYIHWLLAKSKGQSASAFHICNYPFVFDAAAKTALLQTDQAFQMHTAANAAMMECAVINPSMLIQNQGQEHVAYLICSIRRDHIVEDTLTFVQCIADFRDFKKPLKVKFDGEEADDAGGVRKEFFLLLLKEILDPKYGMFKEYEESCTIWFHPNCFEDVSYFFMIGVLCGLAIYNFTIINLPFPLALYKKLLGEDVATLDDLEELSAPLAKGLRDLLDYDGDDIDEVFCLNFTVVEDVFGQSVTKELKANGEDIVVTKENRQEYVQLYCDYVLNKSVDRTYQAFHAGFHKVCGGRVLDLFHARELMALVVGTQNYDWVEFQNHADYKVATIFWSKFPESTQ